MRSDERFKKALNFSKDIDRLPVIEWATWWDKTINVWEQEGLPKGLTIHDGVSDHFELDRLHQFWIPLREDGCPVPSEFGMPVISDPEDWPEVRKYLFTDKVFDSAYRTIKEYISNPDNSDYAYWYTLEGFFWFPRTILGIENHLYAFYDHPDLILEINSGLCKFHKRLIDMINSLIDPVFMTFAEDMSYNHGPMLSKEQYDETMLPFYKELIPDIRRSATKVIIDTDGFVEPLIPWFLEGGIEGILPLERMAGVDVNRIRENHPDLLMIGGYDKTVMHLGEDAMRAEFERILPAIRSGGYIPGVDHQTPPDVSLKNYRIYLRLLREYCSIST